MNDNLSAAPPYNRLTNVPRDLSEDEYLRLQTEQAQASLSESLETLKKSLGNAADLQLWAQHHPWLTVGVAAAAGFAAANVIFARPAPAPANQPYAAPPKNPGMLGSMLTPVFDLMKVALQSSLAGAMAGATQAKTAETTDSAPLDNVTVPPPMPEI